MTTITAVSAHDIRFPTSRFLDGSDAMNPDPDYSAAYCILTTSGGLEGHGFTFTLGRGTELCVHAIESLAPKLVGSIIGLHPLWLMFSLFAFGYLFGFVGILLAVPLAAAAGVLVRFALRQYLASSLYSGVEP